MARFLLRGKPGTPHPNKNVRYDRNHGVQRPALHVVAMELLAFLIGQTGYVGSAHECISSNNAFRRLPRVQDAAGHVNPLLRIDARTEPLTRLGVL